MDSEEIAGQREVHVASGSVSMPIILIIRQAFNSTDTLG